MPIVDTIVFWLSLFNISGVVPLLNIFVGNGVFLDPDKNRRKLSIKKIYLVRHGETELNRKGIVQGSGINASLNTTGIKQSMRFYEKYGEIPFNKIYTSALKRSIESVEPFISTGVAHEPLEGLNEIHWGESEGKKFVGENNQQYKELIDRWKSGDLSYPLPGGESPLDLQKRLSASLDYILSRENEDQILICMHGRAMRALLCIMLNYPLQRMEMFHHRNFALYKIVHTGSMCMIEKYNEVLVEK